MAMAGWKAEVAPLVGARVEIEAEQANAAATLCRSPRGSAG